MADAQWKWYENRVADLFGRMEGAVVERDVSEVGRKTGEPRQLDVRVILPARIDLGEGFEIAIPVKIIVNSKAHGRRLDVATLAQIFEEKDDVEANVAVAVSPLGVTRTARKRAPSLGVYPLTVTGDLLALLHGFDFEFTECKICEWDADEDRPPSEVDWVDDVHGFCGLCNGLHVRCPDCHEVIGLPEAQFGRGVRCAVECGAVFLADYDREGDVRLETYFALDVILMTRAYAKSTKRLTGRQVAKIVQETRWQHWGEATATIGVTEDGLMEWKGGSLYLTPDGEALVKTVLLDPQYALWY